MGITKSTNEVSATVFDLPGCAATAPDREALEELLPVVIAEHASWLAGHGEVLPDAAAVKTKVIEEVDAVASGAADGEFCFAADRLPATRESVERGIQRMAFSRKDLLDTVQDLPDAVLDWRPPASAMARTDPWSPAVLTVREIVQTIARAEGYYRTGTLDESKPDAPTGQPPDLADARQKFVGHLRSLTDSQRAQVFRVRRSWQECEEEWTVRKAIRRVISHERFHTKEVQQRLSWLLLGVPDFQRPPD